MVFRYQTLLLLSENASVGKVLSRDKDKDTDKDKDKDEKLRLESGAKY